jgi:D-beta-D-heptose 7-phosphate kinase/D-beta-D-heptose 1-phosphate adenosyltransferase
VYQYGTVDRISPEAPIPVFVPTYQESKPGMAGNVYANLVTLGCTVNILCGHSSKKTRLIDQRSKQQVLRIDEDVKSTPITFETEIPKMYDAIVISDYCKGVVTYDMVYQLIQEFKGPIFIDTKKHDLAQFQGAWVKINELEHSKLISECSGLIVTLGSKGARLWDEIFPGTPTEVTDVCGAGDTFLAALVVQYLYTNDIKKAIMFANIAAGITVKHLGNYSPSYDEIRRAY